MNVDIEDESVKVFYFYVILRPLLLTGKLFFCNSPMKASFFHILQFREKENLQRVHHDPQLQHKAQESQQGLYWKSAEVIFVVIVVTADRSIFCRNVFRKQRKISRNYCIISCTECVYVGTYCVFLCTYCVSVTTRSIQILRYTLQLGPENAISRHVYTFVADYQMRAWNSFDKY